MERNWREEEKPDDAETAGAVWYDGPNYPVVSHLASERVVGSDHPCSLAGPSHHHQQSQAWWTSRRVCVGAHDTGRAIHR